MPAPMEQPYKLYVCTLGSGEINASLRNPEQLYETANSKEEAIEQLAITLENLAQEFREYAALVRQDPRRKKQG